MPSLYRGAKNTNKFSEKNDYTHILQTPKTQGNP